MKRHLINQHRVENYADSYRIHREANQPVTLCYVLRATMRTGLGPTVELTGHVAHDMDRIRALYADRFGARPVHRRERRPREDLAGCEALPVGPGVVR